MFESKYDHLINELIQDKNYMIFFDGSIYSKKTKKWVGKPHNNTRSNQSSKYYIRVHYKGKALKLHRIIYRKFHGELKPNMVVDHIIPDGLINTKYNLRQITQTENIKRIKRK